MRLIEYRNGTASIADVKQLLSYAAGSSSSERLNQILDKVYSGPDTKLYVMTDNNMVLGIIGSKRSEDFAEILHLAVDIRKRRQGIGRKMIDEWIALEQPLEVTAETDHDAVEFYRKYGFTIHSLGEKYPGVERFLCRFIHHPHVTIGKTDFRA
ncbi:GNAT family N-acetyltransferase [Paenibacillus jiagnxiensis]|uniref:GNAT family N-acetyltransferase n=1 Tax=Paenibacillus jiagnxiensis TaxID=3228926 RepID=UPI0033BC5430